MLCYDNYLVYLFLFLLTRSFPFLCVELYKRILIKLSSVWLWQGIRVLFEDGSRLIYRLSGTGSSGATVRLYAESYESEPAALGLDASVALEPLILVALALSDLPRFTGRDKPTVIT